jgi:hypothetical protein
MALSRGTELIHLCILLAADAKDFRIRLDVDRDVVEILDRMSIIPDKIRPNQMDDNEVDPPESRCRNRENREGIGNGDYLDTTPYTERETEKDFIFQEEIEEPRSEIEQIKQRIEELFKNQERLRINIRRGRRGRARMKAQFC